MGKKRKRFGKRKFRFKSKHLDVTLRFRAPAPPTRKRFKSGIQVLQGRASDTGEAIRKRIAETSRPDFEGIAREARAADAEARARRKRLGVGESGFFFF